jgi:hypothetical protein
MFPPHENVSSEAILQGMENKGTQSGSLPPVSWTKNPLQIQENFPYCNSTTIAVVLSRPDSLTADMTNRCANGSICPSSGASQTNSRIA